MYISIEQLYKHHDNECVCETIKKKHEKKNIFHIVRNSFFIMWLNKIENKDNTDLTDHW